MPNCSSNLANLTKKFRFFFLLVQLSRRQRKAVLLDVIVVNQAHGRNDRELKQQDCAASTMNSNSYSASQKLLSLDFKKM